MIETANLPRLRARREQHYGDGFWRDDSLYSLARENAMRAPDSYALRDSQQRLTYREVLDAADHLAADLAKSGVSYGDPVGIWLPSRVETAVAILACARNGYICCPSLHRSHTASEVAALLTRTGARALITEHRYGVDAHKDVQKENLEEASEQRLEQIQRASPTLQKIYQLKSNSTVADLAELFEQGARDETSPASDPDAVLYIAFTSGTSGEPKCVMHSHNTLLANARTIAADWQFDAASVLYTIGPLSHNLGFGALISAIAVGAELVIHQSQPGTTLREALHTSGATFVFGVPAHAVDLLNEIEAQGVNGLEQLRGFRISGGAVPAHVVAALIDHGITPQSGYGMTEGCSHHYTHPGDDPHLIIETSGRACAGYEVKVFAGDDPDRELPVGEIGEIGGRGASLMLGYFDDEQANADAFNADGWFMTGDLGRLDNNDYLRITGRKKDVIIRGGHNIYPARLESLAMRHAAIKRVAAIAIVDERLGEKVCLAVELLTGKTTDASEVLAHLANEGLSKYDMPEYFVAVDEIPLTASGKILKRALLAAVADGSVTPHSVQRTPAS